MQSSPPPPPKQGEASSRKKKHKSLDDICDSVYKQNHHGCEDGAGPGPGSGGGEAVRRSSRARRPPVMLDMTPTRPKKRRRVDKSRNVKVEEEEAEDEGGWRSRLRDRRKRKGKRKLFEENGEGRERPRVVKSKRPGRVRATNGGKSEENQLHVVKDENLEEEEEEEEEEEVDGGNERESVEGDSVEECIGNENVGAVDCVDNMEISNGGVEQLMDVVEGGNDGEQMRLEQVECVAEGEGQREGVEAVGALRNEERVVEGEDQREGVEAAGAPSDEDCAVEGEDKIEGVESVGASRNEEEIGAGNDGKGSMLTKDDENLAVEVNDVKVNKFKLGKPRIKEGRHCGLCGGGTDGMPPKILDQDTVENENEAYVGSSDSEKFDYNMWDGFGDEPGWLGRLLGPIIDRYGIAGTWVHQNCAVWSPEVYFAGVGCLKNIRAALCRGRALKCTRCGRPGATIGCRVDRCSRTYHLPCARAMGCIFDHRKFLIACTGHRKLFQPLGYQYLIRKKKLKSKKMKLEIRKVSNDAWRKDIEAEEKWLEKCGDDEEFLKRESKRLHRDLVRIAPVYIGGSDSESGKLFQGWESVAGLENVIRCMKEVVILPLLYPEFFDSLSLTPPRGVLLHGYPGTGKTLVVRALIGACARGDKRIAYFARKGADCLGKYVGDAERQLRLLFQVAEKCQPSIIFFDEIDGLAPSRTRQQDQTHSSVVSTLLALMDGLKSRGSVIVIGATNRPDAVDPALRRPGRFDREIYFPLPSEEDRASILSVHTKKWPKPVTGSMLKSIARGTAGFAGADLQALCTQAAIISLKRNFPLQEVLSAAGKKAPDSKRLPLPAFAVEDRDWLEALTCSPPPCSRREVGIAANDVVCSPLPTHLIPCLLQPLSSMLVSLYLDERLWLPTPLRRAAKKIENVVVSALNKKKMMSDPWWSHIDVLLQEADVAKDIEKKLLHAGILLGDATVADSDVCNDDVDERISSFEATARDHGGTRPSLLQSTSVASTNKPGFRILIAGNPRSGQRHLASCLLHCFVGNVEIQKVDLATLLLEGCGNMAQGITQILKKCASVGSCIVFMPRIDLWALEAPNEVTDESYSDLSNHQLSEKEKHLLPEKENPYHKHAQLIDEGSGSLSQQRNSEEIVECQDVTRSTSQAWNLFVEQVESLCVSPSLMILATSEVPCPVLPDRIRQFFNTDILNGHQSVPVKHTFPRFSLQVNGKFDHDLVMNLSAAELSKEIVKQIVLLVHQTSHIHSISYEDRDCHVLTGHSEIVDHSADHGSADLNSNLTQSLDEPLLKAPPPPTNIIGNGKSSLMLAISSFGYQILRYPHFAELCWFTSKLKEGPSADISGPWKGWPFNSCIVRPNNSVEVAVAYTSPKVKSKENFGVVRGLIAVALSAYRGIYTSLREVTSEVRQVLEILVAQINAKIEAGKDRYQYIRLLSQVAYLEDVVYSWAYTLRSLESDAPLKMGNAKPPAVIPPDNDHMDTQVQPKVSSRCSNEQGVLEIGPQEFNTMDDEIADLGNQVQSENIKPNVSRKCSNDHVVLEIGPQAFDSERVVGINVDDEVADLGYSEGGPATVDCSGQGIVLPDSNVVLEIGPRGIDTERIVSIDIDEEVADLGCSEGRPATVDCSGQEVVLPKSTQDKDENLNDIGTNSKPHESESDKIDMVASRDSGSLKHPNGFECTESVAIRRDGLTSDELCSIKLGRSGTISNKLNGLSPSEAGKHNGSKPDADECTLDVNFSSVASLPECLDKDVEFSNKTSLPECLDNAGPDEHLVDGNASPKTNLSSKSGFVCSYQCCSECLETLHILTQKILIEEWRSNRSQWTVDDVHDIVASLSADLLSAVKRIHVSGGFRNSFGDKSRDGHSESSERPESKPCDCKSLGNQILSPAECICHATSVSFPRKENTSSNMHFRFGSKFVFRDGVLVQMDPDKDVSFHCKFETLCLCSLIELIVMTKQPVH